MYMLPAIKYETPPVLFIMANNYYILLIGILWNTSALYRTSNVVLAMYKKV